MELLSDGTRRALTRWDGRPRQIAALLCATLAAIVALTGGGDAHPAEAAREPAAAAGPAAALSGGHVAAVLPIGSASLLVMPGDRVDVYAAPADRDAAWPDLVGTAERVAEAALVLTVAPAPGNQGGAAGASGYVVLELRNDEAQALAGRADTRLTVVVRARDR